MRTLEVNLQGGLRQIITIWGNYLSRRWEYDTAQGIAGQFHGFITDYMSTRYIVMQSGVKAGDVVAILTALANLLRTAEEEGIREIFLQALKLEWDGGRWAVVRR